MLLAVFDFSKIIQDGKTLEPVYDQSSGTGRRVLQILECFELPVLTNACVYTSYSHPLPFRCSIKPRNIKSIELIVGNEEGSHGVPLQEYSSGGSPVDRE